MPFVPALNLAPPGQNGLRERREWGSPVGR
jgi:hypothetical protein